MVSVVPLDTAQQVSQETYLSDKANFTAVEM